MAEVSKDRGNGDVLDLLLLARVVLLDEAVDDDDGDAEADGDEGVELVDEGVEDR